MVTAQRGEPAFAGPAALVPGHGVVQAGAVHRLLRARIRWVSLRLGWYPTSPWAWSHGPRAMGVSGAVMVIGGPVPGGPVPDGGWRPRRQAWAAAVPSGLRAVTHQRVRGWRAAAAARSRASSPS